MIFKTLKKKVNKNFIQNKIFPFNKVKEKIKEK